MVVSGARQFWRAAGTMVLSALLILWVGNNTPVGHASSALWLISVAAFWWPHGRRMAILVGTAMLTLGLAVGWLQQLRGALFLTHTLWSAWVACVLVSALYFFNARGLARLRGVRYDSVPAATQT